MLHGRGGIRTHDRRIRNPLLYPTELRARNNGVVHTFFKVNFRFQYGVVTHARSWKTILICLHGIICFTTIFREKLVNSFQFGHLSFRSEKLASQGNR